MWAWLPWLVGLSLAEPATTVGPLWVDPARLQVDLETLAGERPVDGAPLVSRHVAHPDHERAGAWLVAELEAIGGLVVWTEPFEAAEGSGLRNVVADLPGTDSSAPWVVVGAHWDSTGKADADWEAAVDPAPGADDDASGVAAVLGIARAMAKRQWTHPVRFVLFDAEEQGLIGSAVHAEGMVGRGEEVALMWSMDPIGYNHNDGGLLWVTYDARWEEPGLRAAALAESVTPQLTVTALERELIGGGERSDHASFWGQDYPALHIAGFPQPPTYHTPGDTVDGVDPVFHAAITKLVAAHVAEVAVEQIAADPEKQGCGCASGSGSVGWLGGLLLMAMGRRARPAGVGRVRVGRG